MRTLAEYLAKVPPEHAGDKNFIAELELVLQPEVDEQAFLAALPAAFDVDLAVGVQLTTVGKWIGRDRGVPIPLQNCFFALGDPLRGLGKGVWQNNNNPGAFYTSLDDDNYRRLLRAKAIANEWDGTVAMAQRALDAFFVPGSGTLSFVDDGAFPVQGGQAAQTIMTIGIAGQIPSIVDLEIIAQNLIGLKPATYDVRTAITSINGAPVFGLGVNNQYIGGLGYGALAVTPDYILHSDASLLTGD